VLEGPGMGGKGLLWFTTGLIFAVLRRVLRSSTEKLERVREVVDGLTALTWRRR
jgi:hypothetical protein